ncbi:hypothetical protein [Streptomyces sp. NPDC051219]|uniref:hypothetical protein n=1 Tax=Streptomyces sp. NPDC051219 TaxID=3155283 RepID=UPI00341E955C
MEKTLHGAEVTLRPAIPADVPALAAIRAKPEVYARWRGEADLAAETARDLDDPDVRVLVVERGGRTVGAWHPEPPSPGSGVSRLPHPRGQRRPSDLRASRCRAVGWAGK